MGRNKKQRYEYVAALKQYRKRVKSPSGDYVSLYGRTPEDLERKIEYYNSLQTLSPIGRENLFVNDYIQRWFTIHHAGLTFGTTRANKSVIDCNITPVMEGKRMLEIKPKHIEAVMGGVADKSESIYKATFLILKQVFTSAYENHDIFTNPCPTTRKGGVPPKERVALTDEQVNTLLHAVKDTKAYLFCMLGLYAGLRREEILGLKWDCVFLEQTPRIEVRRACHFVHNQPAIDEKLKTKASKRIIPIPSALENALKSQKSISNSEFVISNTSGGPLSSSQYKSLWHAVIARSTREHCYYKNVDGERTQFIVRGTLGEKVRGHSFKYEIDFFVTPHMLRHTYITNLLLRGVDIRTVQYLAGHAKSAITLDIYAHLTYNRPEDIIDQVESIFEEDLLHGPSKERRIWLYPKSRGVPKASSEQRGQDRLALCEDAV